MLRRIFSIGIIILAVLTIIVGGSALLLHQQRNAIVKSLAKRAQEHFSADVHISDTRIGFSHGIALDLLDVSVSTASATGTAVKLEAPCLHIRLDIFALLKGEIICTKAELVNSHIIIEATDAFTRENIFSHTRSEKAPGDNIGVHYPQFNMQHLNAILSSWRHVVLSTARVEIRHDKYRPLVFSPTNLGIRQKSDSSLPTLALDTMLQRENSPPTRISIHSRINALSTSLAAIDTTTSVGFSLVDTALLQRYLTQAGEEHAKLSGSIDLRLHLQGSLNKGMLGKANIRTSENAENQPAAVHYNGVAIGPGEINITARLTQVPGGVKISEAKISDHVFTLSAEALLATDAKTIELRCSSSPLKFNAIQTWLPDLAPKWNTYLQGSKLTCNALHYSGPLIPSTYTDIFSSMRSSSWNLLLPLASLPTEQGRLAPVQLSISQNTNSVHISSSALNWSSPGLKLNGDLDLNAAWMQNTGNINTRLNLDSLALHINNIEIKKKGAPANLAFTLSPLKQGLSLKNGSLTLPELRATFEAQRDKHAGFKARAAVNDFSLNAFRSRFRMLDFMELDGVVDLDYKLEHTPESGWNGLGKVTLHNCSIDPARILGRIHHINGQVYLDNLSANAPALNLQLGEDSSPLTASASIADLSNPVADIHAAGDGVVANDLIFNSRSALLNNLKGHLRIHAKGIDFVSASVDLEQGTHADVSGILSYKTPDLDLDIHAPYADIDEVIALWHSTPTPEAASKDKTRVAQAPPQNLAFDETMYIDATVTNGIFSGFNFQHASGRINIQRGQLRIEPLEFKADSGNGRAQIIVHTGSNDRPNSYLKVSGELKHINADKVYTQIFGDLGLLSGSLSGTFSLHGPIGSQFTPNADGTFKLSIRDGVLRRFKFLSKAFSLLNVAQLFKMRLPDMSIEGMPFKKLTADLNMENGMLKSNNLFIRSDAMDLALAGKFYLPDMQVDASMNVNPLGTVDSIFSKIPVAGWLLTGDKKTLINMEFDITGPAQEPIVSMKPLSSVSNQVKGIIKRAIDLPSTTVTNPGKVFFHQGHKTEPGQSPHN